MTLTVKQKQAIYEHLLTLDCPDLLAALIAEKSETTMTLKQDTLSECIRVFAQWWQTPETEDFWQIIYFEVVDMEIDFESPAELDFAPTKGETTKLEILVDAPLDTSTCTWTQDVEALSFWTKVKLFFGKWNYKV